MGRKLTKVLRRLLYLFLLSYSSSITLEKVYAQKNASTEKANVLEYRPKRAYAYISITSDSLDPEDKETQNKWKKTCATWGHSMTYRKGQIGFLAKFKCLKIGKNAPEKVDARISAWHINIVESKEAIKIALYFYANKAWQKVNEFGFRNTQGVFKQISGPETFSTLSRMLIDSLPVGWMFRPSDHRNNVVFRADAGPRSLPKRLYVYKVFYDNDLKWYPRIFASLVSKGDLLEGKKKWAQNYTYENIYTPLDPKEVYLVQDRQGLGTSQNLLASYLEKTNPLLSFISMIDILTLKLLSSNYVGVKYGLAMNDPGTILSKVKQLSVLIEIRGGLLSGARLYFEQIPNTVASDKNGDQRLSLRRINAGWSFKLPLPDVFSFIGTEINLQPKIGITNFIGDFVIPVDDRNFRPISYELSGVLDLAGEIGIEKQTNWFRARAWSSVNTSTASRLAGSEGTVTSIRAGIDTYWDLISFSDDVKLNILAFANYERLQLKKPKDQSEDSILLGTDIGFNLALLGGGLTFQW